MEIDEPLPRLPPLQRHQQIETDTFCTGCGYNLFGQVVTRDERLGLMICRCSECGRHHAAGQASTAISKWNSRLATALLTSWVLVVLFASFLLLVGFGAVGVSHVGSMSYVVGVDAQGNVIENGYSGNFSPYDTKNSQSPFGRVPVQYVRTTVPPALPAYADETFREASNRRLQERIHSIWMSLTLTDVALGFGAGCLLANFLWHWPRRRRWVYLVAPAFAALCASAMLVMDSKAYQPIAAWVVGRCLIHAMVQTGFVAVGIWAGRPIGRGLLRLVLPPQTRQYFAFLWRVDDKPVPAGFPAAVDRPAPAR